MGEWKGIGLLAKEVAAAAKKEGNEFSAKATVAEVERLLRAELEPLLGECRFVCQRCEHPYLEALVENWKR